MGFGARYLMDFPLPLPAWCRREREAEPGIAVSRAPAYRSQMLDTFSPLTSCFIARNELRKMGGIKVRITER